MGLMTIGSYGHDYTQGENPDFEILLECKSKVLDHFDLKEADLEMSFGMSNDYIHAIEYRYRLLHNPFQGRQDLLWLLRIHLLPYLHRRTNGRKLSWRTSNRTCGQVLRRLRHPC